MLISKDFPVRFQERPYPPVDIIETDSSIILVCDLPGVDPEGLILKISRTQFFICGVKGDTPSGRRYICMERRRGGFFRLLSLPLPVDPEGAEAVYSEGVLRIRVPKVKDRVYKIKVERE